MLVVYLQVVKKSNQLLTIGISDELVDDNVVGSGTDLTIGD